MNEVYKGCPWEGIVLLYYKYVEIESPHEVCEWQKKLCKELNLKGRIRIAKEGVNGTVAGSAKEIETYVKETEKDVRFQDIDWKRSPGEVDHFSRIQVKVYPELCTIGRPEAKIELTGKHLKPQQFHEELQSMSEKNAILLDCRNIYEYNIGHFENAEMIPVRQFTDFPTFVEENIDSLKDKKVLMYCTGGIRCERGSAFLRSKGIEDVSQLQGGIHRYLEMFTDGGLFKGRNLVFDGRESLAPEEYTCVGKCHICKKSWDRYEIDGKKTRCEECRLLLLTCPECKNSNKHFYCGPDCPAIGLELD